jgi:hypothetical protein
MTEVFELRQYTLHPGKRDALIELFERELIEPQEAAGMRVVGHFRDLDDPDRFVWLRAFPGMAARREALTRFYGGPVWRRFRDEANATMIDSDDVLLLRLVDPRRGFPMNGDRPPVGAAARPSSRFAISVYAYDAQVELPPITLLESEHAENDYPALPVRSGEHVLVSFARTEREESIALPRIQYLRLEPAARSLLR